MSRAVMRAEWSKSQLCRNFAAGAIHVINLPSSRFFTFFPTQIFPHTFLYSLAMASVKKSQNQEEAQSSFNKRIDTVIDQIMDAYRDIIKSSQIRDTTSNSRANFQIEVEAGNLAKNCEALLRIISELKIAFVSQEIDAMNDEAEELRQSYQEVVGVTSAMLIETGQKISQLLPELEEHYYETETLLRKAVE